MVSFQGYLFDTSSQLSNYYRNHNWWHDISEPLDPVPTTPSLTASFTSLQKARVQFYLSLVKATRLAGGSITLAIAPDPPADACPIAAILMWLPPKARWGPFDFKVVWGSSFTGAFQKLGFKGFYRANFVFEANVEAMFATTDKQFGVNAKDCGFVQMVATNPPYAGKGYASALLARQIGLHEAEFPSVPTILDTTTEQGIRAYERLGFKTFGEKKVNTGTDKEGIRLKKGASKEVMDEAEKVCIQRVMIKIP